MLQTQHHARQVGDTQALQALARATVAMMIIVGHAMPQALHIFSLKKIWGPCTMAYSILMLPAQSVPPTGYCCSVATDTVARVLQVLGLPGGWCG